MSNEGSSDRRDETSPSPGGDDDENGSPAECTRESERGDGPQPVTGSDDPPNGGRRGAPWMRLSGAGMELALITLVFGAGGRWVDGQMANERSVVSALAGLVGFTFGMIRFIRIATRLSEEERRRTPRIDAGETGDQS